MKCKESLKILFSVGNTNYRVAYMCVTNFLFLIFFVNYLKTENCISKYLLQKNLKGIVIMG